MYEPVPDTASLVQQHNSQGNMCPSAQTFKSAFMRIDHVIAVTMAPTVLSLFSSVKN